MVDKVEQFMPTTLTPAKSAVVSDRGAKTRATNDMPGEDQIRDGVHLTC
jgi:hypothetical protein